MQIVEKYGGTLKVEDSEDLGGAKFIVRFNKADIG
jgi:signal transduction histidine kinase